MSQRGQQLAENIRDALACPRCDYSLRGLPGTIVHCPECGLECDVAQMISCRWTASWTRAPGYTQVLRPVAVAAIAPWVILLLSVAYARQSNAAIGWMIVCSLLTALGLWICMLRSCVRWLPDIEAMRLSFLAHALFLGYVLALVGIVWALIGVLVLRTLPAAGICIVLVGLCVVLFIVCRRGERYIARRCIQQHLLRRSPASR